MKFSKIIILCFLCFGPFFTRDFLLAENKNTNQYKVLSANLDQFSINNVQNFLNAGDEFVNNGNLEKAKDSYDQARDLAKQLSGFFRDLNGSFRGIDARIPREMDLKGRQSLKIWAESNAKLSALYKRKNQPEVSVPLLVEIIRLMAPTSPEGKAAYNELIELGFVETPYKGI